MAVSGFLVLCLLGLATAQYGSYQSQSRQDLGHFTNSELPSDSVHHQHQHQHQSATTYSHDIHHGHHQGHHEHHAHHHSGDISQQGFGTGFQDGRNGFTQRSFNSRRNGDSGEEVTSGYRGVVVPHDKQSFNALNARQILQHRGLAVPDSGLSARFGGDDDIVQSVQPRSSFVKRPVSSGLIL